MRERRVDYSFWDFQGERELLPEQIVFHHIPKTAGSSFNQILRTLYDETLVCNAVLDHELDQAAIGGLDRYGLFAGHFSFDALRRHFGAATRLTFLRDPVQRCISQYHNWHDTARYVKSWIGRNETNPEVETALQIATQMSLGEFVCSKNLTIADSTQNMMTRYLASRTEWKQEAGYYDSALVEEAKHNLVNYFHFFGLTEQFERSRLILAQTLGIRPWDRMDALLTNRNPKKTSFDSGYDITPEEASILNDYNLMDIELYDFALREFNSRFENSYRELMQHSFEFLAGRELSNGNDAHDCYEFSIETANGARGLHFSESVLLPDKSEVIGRWTGLESSALWEIPLRVEKNGFVVVEVKYLAVESVNLLAASSFSFDYEQAVQHTNSEQGKIKSIRLVFSVRRGAENSILHVLRLVTPLVRAEDKTREVGVFLLDLQAYSV